MRRKVFLISAAFALFLLLLVACTASGPPSVDEIVARLQEAQQHPQPVHMLTDITFSMPDGESQHLVVEQWVAPGGKMRLEYKEGPPEVKGMLLVSDGATMWTYMPQTKGYFKMDLSQVRRQQPSPEEMAAEMRDWVKQALDTMTFTYLGMEEVAGRKAYKLRAQPKAGLEEKAPFEGEVTLWIDAERWEVLGMESAGEGMRLSWKVRAVEYKEALSDELFTFTPPPDARPRGGGEEGEAQVLMPGQMLTLEEAQQAVEFEILVPQEMPEGFQLLGVQVMEPPGMGGMDVGKMVTLVYQKGFQVLTIGEMPLPEEVPTEVVVGTMPGVQGEEVTVRGHQAVLKEIGIGGRSLVWQERGLLISITGQVDKETLLRVAEGLE